MRLRPFLSLCLALGLALMTTGVQARSSWHTFTSHSGHFSFQYPSTWRVSSAQPNVWQVTPSGGGQGALTVSILPLKPGRTLAETRKEYLRFAPTGGSGNLSSVHWSAITLGGKAGFGGVLHLATEGGTKVSQGFLVAPYHGHVYQITETEIGGAPTSLAQFPATDRQIIASWRFR